MEQPSSSSKVKVEYFDPSGVFQLISSSLLARLPLRYLHWESHAGPLRSIDSLHVDLVPAATNDGITSPSNPDLTRVKSTDSSISGDDGFKVQPLANPGEKDGADSRATTPRAQRERRHQIPGLRQTPYLKVFLLRCDDNESYKQTARKQVRDWIKEHTPPQSGSKATAQENHDAFEWLILHVIVPNTAAASQPRTLGKTADSVSGSTEKSSSRWLGSSSTILDKLRSDFNSSSKSAIDRIAQVRVGINDVPYDMLPRVVPAIPGSYTESAKDNELAWDDLITKMKSLILSSFDLRVSQYEEDVREKDAQRNLPGWNFCTFFVLKEGLARGFESVGLVEDALVGYDELSLGLDSIVQEKAAGSETHGSSFLPWTDDLKKRVETARAALARGGDDTSEDTPIDLQSKATPEQESAEIPLTSTKKPYRDLILSSNVSLFDFRCYLFSRQLAVLLRLANASSSKEELLAKLKEQRESSLQGVAARPPPTQPSDEPEKLNILAEVCRRAMEFISAIARIMREDILAYLASVNSTDDAEKLLIEDPQLSQLVENMISSFTFSAAQQILAQTSTKSLPIPTSALTTSSEFGEPKAAIPEPKTMMHPARTSSLLPQSPVPQPPSPGIFPGPGAPPSANPSFLKTGLEELSGRRAELYIYSRSVLQKLGRERGWSVGWDTIPGAESAGTFEDVDLEKSEESPRLIPILHGIDNLLLKTAVQDKDGFYRLYETLTDKSLRHFTVANRFQSMQANVADLAVLKYFQEDYAAASSYFYRMVPFYGEEGWTQIEIAMLIMYVQCLRKLQRKEEYVRAAIKLLTKGAASQKEKLAKKSFSLSEDDSLDLTGYLRDLLDHLKDSEHDVSASLQSFFGRIEVTEAAIHHDSQDTFSLQLGLQYLQADDFEVEKIKVQLVPIKSSQGQAIWFESQQAETLTQGTVQVQVNTNTIIPGYYTLNQVVMQSGKLHLKYDAGANKDSNDQFLKSPEILIYQHPEAVDVKVSASRYMHLDQNRTIELELSSGWNSIIKCEMTIRPATAGLRLQTSETKMIEGVTTLQKTSEAGMVKLGAIAADSFIRLRIPFNLERELADITFKIEVTYTTENGTFVFATTPTVSILLPLGVNVQDIFKRQALFSRFTITSAGAGPLWLLASQLEGSEFYEATTRGGQSYPLVVFQREPASLLYKLTKKVDAPSKPAKKTSLFLSLSYICLSDEIDYVVTRALADALKGTSLYQYGRLITLRVLAQIHERLSPQDIERAALLGELSTSFISSVRWRDMFTGIVRDQRNTSETAKLLDEWLREWHAKTPAISLPLQALDDAILRAHSIVIPVEVPSVDVVFTADFKMEPLLHADDEIVALANLPANLVLNIDWTRIWTAPGVKPTESDVTFAAEVTTSTDFLIGGRRRLHFTVSSAENAPSSVQLPIMLIPLKEGYYQFPHVEIRHVPNQLGDESSEAQLTVTCETDFKNSAETIRVISNARKTTVSLDASGPQGGAWLLESERWGVGEERERLA